MGLRHVGAVARRGDHATTGFPQIDVVEPRGGGEGHALARQVVDVDAGLLIGAMCMPGMWERSVMRTALILPLAAAIVLAGCGDDDGGGSTGPAPTPTPSPTATASPTPPVTAVDQRVVASFDNPWAMVFLPDGRLLVTEKPGRLQLVTQAGVKTPVANVPRVTYSGQLGLQDVVLDPGFATNARIWISYAEPATGGQQLAVARATLNMSATPRLDDVTVIWRATPATTGGQLGAAGHRPRPRDRQRRQRGRTHRPRQSHPRGGGGGGAERLALGAPRRRRRRVGRANAALATIAASGRHRHQ